MSLSFNSEEVINQLGFKAFRFNNNWAHAEKDKDITNIVETLLKALFSKDQELQLLTIAKGYELASILILKFADVQQSSSQAANIKQYVVNHYNENLSLDVVSKHFFMEPSYFSKYFKKRIGINFKEFLMDVRLSHAKIELIESDKSIVFVSMHSGFNSLSSFNRAFKAKYTLTPSNYRKENAKVVSKTDPSNLVNAPTQYKTNSLLSKYPINSDETSVLNLEISSLKAKQNTFSKVSTIINLGDINNFNRDEWKNHIEKLLMITNFVYVRMTINISSFFVEKELVFEKVKNVIDYSTLKGLIPWFTFKVTRSFSEKDIEKVKFIISFLKDHLTESVVEKWKFEVEIALDLLSQASIQSFRLIKKTIVEILPNALVGGIGFDLTKNDDIKSVLSKFDLDFITVKGFLEINEQVKTSSNINYWFQHFTDRLIHTISNINWGKNVYIPEMGVYLTTNNYLQNTLFSGAYLINSIIRLFSSISGFGYILGSDAFQNHHGITNNVITSGPGLLTDNGLEKPSLTAIKFINEFSSVKDFCLLRDSFLAGFVDNEIYVLGTNIQYPLLTLETNLQDAKNIKTYLPKALESVNLTINDLNAGSYEIRIFKCHKDILDNWEKFDFYDSLRNSDIDLLRQKDGVSVNLRVVKVNDKVLNIKLPVEANNFFVVHIRKKQKLISAE